MQSTDQKNKIEEKIIISDEDDTIGAGNFKAWTFFSHFQNAGRQGATRETITGVHSLTEYSV